MSRSLALVLLLVCSLSFASTAQAASVRDDFDAIAYNGNNGTANWTGNWVEVGEADGPAAGFLHVEAAGECNAGNCLRLGTAADIDINQRILYRQADLSGSASATLTFDWETFNADRGFVRVEVSGNGGGSWTTLITYDLGSINNTGSEVFDISAFIAANTQIRFRATNRNDDPFDVDQFRGSIYVDDVQIQDFAAAGMYYWQVDSGTSVAGFTTDSTACGSQERDIFLTTLMTTGGFNCANFRHEGRAAVPQNLWLIIKDTPYAIPTDVTGIDFSLNFLDDASGGVTARYELGYALGGLFTSFGFVDEGPNEPQALYITDLSSISGTAPAGSHLALRIVDVAPSPGDMRMFNGSSTGGGILNVSEVAAGVCPGGVVTTTADSIVGGSLRACIIWANGNPGTDTLTLPGGTYTLSLAGTGENAAASGDLDITDDIIIDGDAVSATIINANGIDRVFEVLNVSATFSNLTIRDGNVTGEGGGIAVSAAGSVSMSESTLSANTATTDGGGIMTAGTLALTNVTVSGNTADAGGGLDCLGACTLTNVTVTANTAPTNGGGVRQRTGAGSISFLNTIVANNFSTGAVDCDGNTARLFSNGNNISSDASCDFTNTGDQENTDPLLGPLQDNGGPTFTHELLAGSPAIEAGTNAGSPATDQRGLARPAGVNCDVGAYEYSAVPVCPVTTTADSGPGSLRECLVYANSNPGTPVRFNIPGPGNRSAGADSWWAISPLTPLPAIAAANTIIDGTTQTTNQGDTNSIGPEIELDGSLAGGGTHGLVIDAAGDGSEIRGLQINRFVANGIQVSAGANGAIITGNWIGSDGSGAAAPGNGNNGINLLGGSATIGGTGAADRNVINNNGNDGINLTGGGATGNTILGNYIGLEYDGTSGSGNSDVGIAILSGAAGNTIGGLTAASRNLISMNFEGMEINSPNNVVVGNYIGTDAGGTLDRGNRSDDGVEIQSGASGNTIGGTVAGAGNLIAFNARHGINIVAGTANIVLGNSVHSNDLLGIDLGNDGVTTNDVGDPDAGPNDLLNFPAITSVSESGGNLTANFDLDVPAGDYRVEFFTNPLGADPSGNGEGEIFADALMITHAGAGIESFSHIFAGAVGDIISATATEEFAGPIYGSTSEFATVITAAAAPVCPGGTVTNIGDSGSRSLRDCILFANANPGTTVGFDIPGPGNRSSGADDWFAISPTTPLPAITAAGTVIDGTTQTSNRGDSNSRGPEIEIDGAGTGLAANGLNVGVTADGSTIRGLAIGNFSDNGILILSDSNVIAGNYLGLSADGNTIAANNPAAAQHLGGVRIESTGNTIGGMAAADRNVASGNGFAGIELFGAAATGNFIYGNYAGLDATGALARPNSQAGVDLELASDNFIGGPLPGQRNVLSGNASDGVEIDGGDRNVIQGNYIGTDASGTVVIPNGRDGIDVNENGGVGADNSLIGGTGANEGNLIRGNTLYGINVRDALVNNIAILGNQIFENVLLDIDLNDDGVTPNDSLDSDAGPNDLLNYPVIVAAPATGGTITVYYQLDVPAGDYRIEFFSNPSGAHATGNGGGEVLIGANTITHAGTGAELFAYVIAGAAGVIITATATEELAGPVYNSTSEFSTAFIATAAPAPFTARWPLDETSGIIAADVDAGNDGTYLNGVLLNQAGACSDTGTATYFDGLDDLVEVPHSPDYLMDEGTVSFWAKVDALGTAQSLFSKDSQGFDTGGHLTLDVQPGGQIRVRLQTATSDNFVISPPIVPGTWVHVAFGWGPGGMALYIDGAAPVTDPYVGGLGATSGGSGNFEPIAFGASTMVSDNFLVTPTEEHLAGFLDDVRINNRALSLAEIQTLATCTPGLDIVKRAFWLDGTQIPTGAVIPSGVEFKYLLYINNPNVARTDISVRDVLNPAFAYQPGSIQVDNSVAQCAAATCTVAEELAIFTTVDGTAFQTDATGDDVASYTGGSLSIDAGNQNVANPQLDINANAVWAVMFSVKMP